MKYLIAGLLCLFCISAFAIQTNTGTLQIKLSDNMHKQGWVMKAPEYIRSDWKYSLDGAVSKSTSQYANFWANDMLWEPRLEYTAIAYVGKGDTIIKVTVVERCTENWSVVGWCHMYVSYKMISGSINDGPYDARANGLRQAKVEIKGIVK